MKKLISILAFLFFPALVFGQANPIVTLNSNDIIQSGFTNSSGQPLINANLLLTGVNFSNGTLNLQRLDVTGASSGYVLTYNGTGLVWSAASVTTTGENTLLFNTDGNYNVTVSGSGTMARLTDLEPLAATANLTYSNITSVPSEILKVGNGTYTGNNSITTVGTLSAGAVPVSLLTGTLGLSAGGTGASTAAQAVINLLPAQSGNTGKVLATNGSLATWTTATGLGDLLAANNLSDVVSVGTARINLGVALASQNLTSYGFDDALRRFRAKLAYLANGSTTTTPKIVLMGDSWVSQGLISAPLITEIFNKYGNGGGFLTTVSTALTNSPEIGAVVTGGSWTDLTTPNFGGGVGGGGATSTSVGASKVFTFSGNGFSIYYVTQSGGGTFNWSLDGGANTTVSTDAASSQQFVTVTGLEDTQHKLVVAVETGGAGVIIGGVETFRSTPGVKVLTGGSGGLNTAGLYGYVADARWQTIAAALDADLYIFIIGTNDAEQISAAAYAANVLTARASVLSVTASASVLLALPALNGNTSAALTIAPLRDAILPAAQTNNLAVFDGTRLFGSYTFASAEGLWNDTKHLSTVGGYLYGRALFAALDVAGKGTQPGLTEAQGWRVTNLLGGVYWLGATNVTRNLAAFNPVTGLTVGANVTRTRQFPVAPGVTATAALLEGTATNLLLYSEVISNAAWNNDADLTVTDNAAVAPDNTLTADLAKVGTATDPEFFQAVTITANQTVGLSFYFKLPPTPAGYLQVRVSSDADANGFQGWLNLKTFQWGTAAAFGTGALLNKQVKIFRAANGWYWAWISGKTDTAATAVTVKFRIVNADNSTTSASVNDGIFLWGLQAESATVTGDGVTSYIATTSATVTRPADTSAQSLTSGNLSWGYDTGTLITYYEPLSATNFGGSTSFWQAATSGSWKPQLWVQISNSPGTVVLYWSEPGDSLLNGSWAGGSTYWANQPRHQLIVTWRPYDVEVWVDGVLRMGPMFTTYAYFKNATSVTLGPAKGWQATGYLPRALTGEEIRLLYEAQKSAQR